MNSLLAVIVDGAFSVVVVFEMIAAVALASTVVFSLTIESGLVVEICFLRPTALVDSYGGVILGTSSTFLVGVGVLIPTLVNDLGFSS